MKGFTSVLILVLFTNPCPAQSNFPSDPQATKATIHLYKNLFILRSKGFLFGHQDDIAYGVHWKYQKDSSDVKSITGDYPALYGWDLSGIESGHENNIDGVPFKMMAEFIQQGYERGGVITISWHAPSPMGGNKTAWDTTHGTVASILPGASNHDRYKNWLDKIAQFIASLKGKQGASIPLLFRPFHELTGTWFWWCKNTCSPEEFKELWRFTVHYLRDEKKLHNLLFVYNTSGEFETPDGFLERYPGDDVVDVLSFDNYQYGNAAITESFEKNTGKALEILENIANRKHKLFAMAETGYEQIPYASWWTEKLLKAIGDHKISYVLVWRNQGWLEGSNPPHMHYYIPVKGDPSEKDFIRFYRLGNTLFEKDAAKENLYR